MNGPFYQSPPPARALSKSYLVAMGVLGACIIVLLGAILAVALRNSFSAKQPAQRQNIAAVSQRAGGVEPQPVATLPNTAGEEETTVVAAEPPVQVAEPADAPETEEQAIAAIRELGGTVELSDFKGRMAAKVSLGNSRVTDADLSHLRAITYLRELFAGGLAIGDEGVAHLNGNLTLESLGLEGTKITDAALAHLATLPYLTNLSVANSGVTEAGLSELAKCPELAILSLEGLPITDAGLDRLRGMPKLQIVVVAGTQVTLSGVQAFQSAMPLCKVQGGPAPADQRRVSNADPARPNRANALRRANQLRPALAEFGARVSFGAGREGVAQVKVSYSAKELGTDAFAKMATLPDIDMLWFESCSFDPADLGQLSALPYLRFLTIVDNSADDEMWIHLAEYQALEILNLDLTRVTGVGLSNLKGLAALRDLRLTRNPISIEGMEQLGQLTQLEVLALYRTPVNDEGVAHLATLAGLKELFLGETKITDAGLVHVTRLANLTALHLDTTDITDAGLMQLTALTQLKTLDLRGTKVSEAAVTKLKEALPELDIKR